MKKALFAGLMAGEASFSIRPNNGGSSWSCCCGVNLREDDTPLLDELRRTAGCGSLYRVPARGNSRPQTAWVVNRQRDCRRLLAYLDDAPLLGKKAGDLALWRTAVEVWNGSGGTSRWVTMADLARRMTLHRRVGERRDYTVPTPGRDYLGDFLAGFSSA